MHRPAYLQEVLCSPNFGYIFLTLQQIKNTTTLRTLSTVMGALLLTDFSPNDDIMAIITECVHVSTFHSVLNLIAYVMQSKHIHEYTFEFVELLRDA